MAWQLIKNAIHFSIFAQKKKIKIIQRHIIVTDKKTGK